MNKDELLQELSFKVARGEVTREEVAKTLGLSVPTPLHEMGKEETKKYFSITKILYVLGISVAVLGIIFFAAEIWYDIGSWGRILITLGMGLFLALIGSLLLNQKPESYLGQVFHVIAGTLIPGGALVTLYELGSGTDSLWPVTITIGIITLFYFLVTVFHRTAVLTFFTIANATAFIYLLVQSILVTSYYTNFDVYAYLTMIIGVSYLLMSYSFRGTWNKDLAGVLNFFGIAGFMGAAFSRVFESDLWEFLFFLVAIGGLALAVYIKSRSILVVSTLFLIAHFVYITNEYFANSIGWPISLVILGFVFIALGYMSININKKYITEERSM